MLAAPPRKGVIPTGAAFQAKGGISRGAYPRAYVGTAALGCPSSEARVLWRRTQRRVIIKSVMATQKSMLDEMKLDQRYAVSAIEDVLTPALLLYPEEIANNIDRTLALLSGDPNRWRVHIKTAKLSYTLKMLLDRGVQNFKCATTLELLTACRTGATDVLLAYPAMGANARRAHEIAQQFPEVRISVLVESEEQVQQWRTRRVGIFLDINPGMNRTGIDQSDTPKIISLVQAVTAASLEFRGLHYYDGQYGDLAEPERTQATHRGYDRLLKIASELERSGMPVAEIITAGTPTFPCSLSYEDFRHGNFIHRISPGTIIYCDATSLHQLPAEYGYRPAALVLTRVVSHPHPGIVTCDAGHKTVSADAGIPICIVLGHPELTPLSPSEEHLPIAVKEAAPAPPIGEGIYLLPRHVCPTVNNFNDALLIRNGTIESTEPVSARGREAPLLYSQNEAPSLRGA
jgi:D-serine deaminase-like pyridoxal phosphate-dependent protein